MMNLHDQKLDQKFQVGSVAPMKKSKSPRSTVKRHLTLAQRRDKKMAGSAQAFVRGSTLQFYEWLNGRSAGAVPKGPAIWICGDAHAGNLGPVADSAGDIHIQIRDFDQTVIGNPNHDLIRLALSLASAARGCDLPGVTTAEMLEHMMQGYEGSLRGRGVGADKPECVRVVMRRSLARTWKHLARERLRDMKPNIPLGERFWPLSRQERRAMKVPFDQDRVRRLVTSLKSRDNEATIEILDSPSY